MVQAVPLRVENGRVIWGAPSTSTVQERNIARSEYEKQTGAKLPTPEQPRQEDTVQLTTGEVITRQELQRRVTINQFSQGQRLLNLTPGLADTPQSRQAYAEKTRAEMIAAQPSIKEREFQYPTGARGAALRATETVRKGAQSAEEFIEKQAVLTASPQATVAVFVPRLIKYQAGRAQAYLLRPREQLKGEAYAVGAGAATIYGGIGGALAAAPLAGKAAPAVSNIFGYGQYGIAREAYLSDPQIRAEQAQTRQNIGGVQGKPFYKAAAYSTPGLSLALVSTERGKAAEIARIRAEYASMGYSPAESAKRAEIAFREQRLRMGGEFAATVGVNIASEVSGQRIITAAAKRAPALFSTPWRAGITSGVLIGTAPAASEVIGSNFATDWARDYDRSRSQWTKDLIYGGLIAGSISGVAAGGAVRSFTARQAADVATPDLRIVPIKGQKGLSRIQNVPPPSISRRVISGKIQEKGAVFGGYAIDFPNEVLGDIGAAFVPGGSPIGRAAIVTTFTAPKQPQTQQPLGGLGKKGQARGVFPSIFTGNQASTQSRELVNIAANVQNTAQSQTAISAVVPTPVMLQTRTKTNLPSLKETFDVKQIDIDKAFTIDFPETMADVPTQPNIPVTANVPIGATVPVLVPRPWLFPPVPLAFPGGEGALYPPPRGRRKYLNELEAGLALFTGQARIIGKPRTVSKKRKVIKRRRR